MFPPADSEELGWEESGIVMAGISKKRKKNLLQSFDSIVPTRSTPKTFARCDRNSWARVAEFLGLDTL